MPVPRTREEWVARAGELRLHVLASCGLWPMPEKTPLNPTVFGRIERDGYTVEKAYFESHPGFFVTGNLYRPAGREGKLPGVLAPHGHWDRGRLQNDDVASLPGRCISFARQGYVAFSYDMIGYNDSAQVDHRFGGKREELWGISLAGLQLWNSIRAIDFLCALPDVDGERLGCTGASGGGTQTFLLAAVDDRVRVSAPVCMVSAFMQGGCLCENPPNLRIHTSNVELAALTAPRPMLLVAATGDWTRSTPHEEFPAIKAVYDLFEAGEKVRHVLFDDAHNYNKRAREAVYAWFGRWLLGVTEAEQLREKPFEVEKEEDLRVWHGVPRPPNALDREGLVRYLIHMNRGQLERSMPVSPDGLAKLRGTCGAALRHALCVERPAPSEIVVTQRTRYTRGGHAVESIFISRKESGDCVPGLLVLPENSDHARGCVLVVHPEGKDALFGPEDGALPLLLTGLLESGVAVLSIDCFLTGELPRERARYVSFFSTYNRTDASERVQDMLTAMAYVKSHPLFGNAKVALVGLGKAAIWCLFACAFSPEAAAAAVDVACVAAGGADGGDEIFLDDLYIPCVRRAGDIRTAAALVAPRPLFIHGTGESFTTNFIAEAYRSASAPNKLRVWKDRADDDDLLRWFKESVFRTVG